MASTDEPNARLIDGDRARADLQMLRLADRHKINRKDFGIDIEMPLEGGGVVVGDKVTINLEIEALKAQA